MKLLIAAEESPAEGGIDWERLGIDTVLTVCGAGQARKKMEESDVDIVLCDMEMQQETEIEFLEWARRAYPAVQLVILSHDAEFSSIARTMRLGCAAYLLKPASLRELEENIRLAAVRRREAVHYCELEGLRERWEKNLPRILGDFWLDIVERRLEGKREDIIREAEKRGIFFISHSMYGEFLPVLIRIREWKRDIGSRDKRILEFALCNVADEILMRDHMAGQTLCVSEERFVSILMSKRESGIDREACAHHVRELCRACKQYFPFRVSVRMGRPAFAHEIADVIDGLEDPEENPGGEKTITGRAQDFIAANLGERLSRKRVAEALFVNPDYLGRVFRRDAGMLITDYILRKKVEKAQQLLDKTDLAISAVAAEVGFDNFSYFARLFRRRVGMNPQEYRRQCAKRDKG